jgi:dihydropteroate synthase
MGILNVTPDSFSDGGRYDSVERALAHAGQLVEAGADFIDVGAESTRPGASPVSLDDEWQRLEPVLIALNSLRSRVRISVDTQKPEIMGRVLALGIAMINDVGGHATPEILREIGRQRGMQYMAMHVWGEPQTMQKNPLTSHEVLGEFERFGERIGARALAAGIAEEHLWLDPGIGFGKTDAANVALLGQIPRWSKRWQVAIGLSRKSLMGRLLAIPRPEDRDPPSKMLELGAALLGARLIRSHEIAMLKRLVSLMEGDR